MRNDGKKTDLAMTLILITGPCHTIRGRSILSQAGSQGKSVADCTVPEKVERTSTLRSVESQLNSNEACGWGFPLDPGIILLKGSRR